MDNEQDNNNSGVVRNKRGTTKPEEPQKKMTGAGYYVVLSITIIEDILDIFLSFITPVTSIIVTLIIFIYLYSQKVDMSSKTAARWILSFIIEAIPILNILPTYSIVFALTKAVENNEAIKKVAQMKDGHNPNITRAKRG